MTGTFEAIGGLEKNHQERILNDLGQVNLQLLELIRDGLIEPSMKIFENCCGFGHNIRFFIKHGYNSFGTDVSEEAIQLIKEYLPGWNSSIKANNFQVADPLALPFEDNTFDFSYALHFSELTKNTENLAAFIKEAIRVIRSSGILFLLLETSIGLEGKILHISGNRYLMQDGSERVLLSEKEIKHLVKSLNLKTLSAPLTVLQHSKRSQTYISFIKN